MYFMQMDFQFILEEKDASITLYAKLSFGFLLSFAATLLLLPQDVMLFFM